MSEKYKGLLKGLVYFCGCYRISLVNDNLSNVMQVEKWKILENGLETACIKHKSNCAKALVRGKTKLQKLLLRWEE